MKQAKVIEQKDIKKILAEKFGVDENNIIKSQYSYIIIESSEESEEEQPSRVAPGTPFIKKCTHMTYALWVYFTL